MLFERYRVHILKVALAIAGFYHLVGFFSSG